MKKTYMIITERIPKSLSAWLDNTIASPSWRDKIRAKIRLFFKYNLRRLGILPKQQKQQQKQQQEV